MAEIVELRLQRGINELLQLERVNLFTEQEIKTIIKKRRSFEYKLQSFNKTKFDYLKYISYEESLLRLIKLRRKKIGYQHKIKEIDHTIATRIGAVFRSVIFKHQSDVKLWLSYIDFCKSMRWNGKVGAIYTRMLQVHNCKDYLWISAAKFEFEENKSSSVARSLIQRGIRFNKQSHLLWKEYFRFEILFAEKVQKRRHLMADQQITDLQMDKDQDVEVEKDNDAILNGQVALIVVQTMAKETKDASLLSSLIPILRESQVDFVDWLEQEIMKEMSKLEKGDEKEEEEMKEGEKEKEKEEEVTSN